MQVQNLKVGMILKNYKELCTLLSIEPAGSSGSNSRLAQVKNISRRIKYRKIEGSNRLEILEIYKEEKEKEDSRIKGNNSKYVENIENIILYTLNKHSSDDPLILSRGKLLEVCNMINENYRIGRSNISKISAITDIESDYIYNFYSHSNAMLSKSIVTSLKSLRNRRVIDYYDTIMICEDIVDTVVIDNNVEFIKTGEYRFREATEDERKSILKYEKEAIRILGCRKIQDIILKGKWKEFKQITETMIKGMYNRNINYYYGAYKMIYNAEDVAEEISILELENSKGNLNSKVTSSLSRSTKIRHTKANNATKKEKQKIESHKDYVDKQLMLLELLVKNNPKDKL